MKKAINPNHGWQTVKQKKVFGSEKTICGDCVHFPICSKNNVKRAQRDTDYCLWGIQSGLFVDNELRFIHSLGLAIHENNI